MERNYVPRVIYAYDRGMGGFALRFLQFILGPAARWFVCTLPLAKDAQERDFAVSLVNSNINTTHLAIDAVGKKYPFTSYSVQYAYKDDDKYVYVIVAGQHGWLSFLRENGIMVKAMGKVVKRLKSINRPTLLGAEFGTLNIEVVSNTQYVDPDFHDRLTRYMASLPEHLRMSREDYEAMPLDGWIAENAKVRGEQIRQAEFHEDFLNRKLQLNVANSSSQVNTRIMFGPGCTDAAPEGGLAKGNSTIGRGMGDVDYRMAASAIKAEVTSDRRCIVISEPQSGKDAVMMSSQYFTNIGEVIANQKRIDEIMRDYISQGKKLIVEGRVMSSFSDVHSARWDLMRKSGEWADGISRVTKYGAIEWVMRGGDLRKSPFHVKRQAQSMVENLIDQETGNIRFPIPCAWHAQVISESAARMAGHTISVPEGKYKWIKSIGVVVVNDMTWIRNYLNWGTPDFDDFFDGIEVTINGVKGAIVVRHPNELGGWVFLEHMDGEPAVEWRKATGKVVTFPEVNGKLLPRQITERLIDGSLVYKGLPSASRPKPIYDGSEYSPDFFIKDVDESVNTVGVGAYVKARRLYTQVFGKVEKTSVFRCSVNDAVDVFVQAGAADDRRLISAEADELVDKVVESGLPVDELTWSTGFARFYTGDIQPNLVEGRVSRAHKLVEKHINAFLAWAELDYGQKMAAVPNNIIFTLGGYQASLTPINQRKVWHFALNDNYQEAMKLLEDWRKATGRANSSIDAQMDEMADNGMTPRKKIRISPATWVKLYAPIMEAITSREGKDRHDFVMALIAVQYKKKTWTTNMWSDTIIFNNQRDENGVPTGPFPYVVEAMRFYGLLADELTFDEDERVLERKFITSWDLTCTVCGEVTTLTDPVAYQAYSYTNLVCKNCREQQS